MEKAMRGREGEGIVLGGASGFPEGMLGLRPREFGYQIGKLIEPYVGVEEKGLWAEVCWVYPGVIEQMRLVEPYLMIDYEQVVAMGILGACLVARAAWLREPLEVDGGGENSLAQRMMQLYPFKSRLLRDPGEKDWAGSRLWAMCDALMPDGYDKQKPLESLRSAFPSGVRIRPEKLDQYLDSEELLLLSKGVTLPFTEHAGNKLLAKEYDKEGLPLDQRKYFRGLCSVSYPGEGLMIFWKNSDYLVWLHEMMHLQSSPLVVGGLGEVVDESMTEYKVWLKTRCVNSGYEKLALWMHGLSRSNPTFFQQIKDTYEGNLSKTDFLLSMINGGGLRFVADFYCLNMRQFME